jgi:hypothetical protein
LKLNLFLVSSSKFLAEALPAGRMSPAPNVSRLAANLKFENLKLFWLQT